MPGESTRPSHTVRLDAIPPEAVALCQVLAGVVRRLRAEGQSVHAA